MAGERYEADSLIDIAMQFERMAVDLDNSASGARTTAMKTVLRNRATTWREAASILRKTTLRTQQQQAQSMDELLLGLGPQEKLS